MSALPKALLFTYTLPSERRSLLWLKMCALEARTLETNMLYAKRRLSGFVFISLGISKQTKCAVKKIMVFHQRKIMQPQQDKAVGMLGQVEGAESWRECQLGRGAERSASVTFPRTAVH